MIARARTSLGWLWGGFVASRAVIVAGALMLGEHFLPDVRLYGTWSILLADRQFPVGDAYWQYPPGAGALFLAGRLLAPDPLIGFIVLALIADALLLALLARAARRRGTDLTAAWTWVIGGLLVGPLLVSRFDAFPGLLAAAAVLAASRPAWSGALAGLGGMLKVWPLLALVGIRRRGLPVAMIAAVLTMAVVLVVMTWWGGDGIAFLAEQRDRGLQIESVGALPYLLTGDPQTVLRFGAFEIGVPGAASVGLGITLLGLVVIAAFGVLRLAGRLEDCAGGDVTLALVLVSVATSRVFSPQYDVWIVAVGAAALADPASRMRRVMWWLLGMCALTQVIFPWAYGSLIDGQPYAVALQSIRLLILLGCTVAACAACLRAGRLASRSADDATDAAEPA